MARYALVYDTLEDHCQRPSGPYSSTLARAYGGKTAHHPDVLARHGAGGGVPSTHHALENLSTCRSAGFVWELRRCVTFNWRSLRCHELAVVETVIWCSNSMAFLIALSEWLCHLHFNLSAAGGDEFQ